MRAWHPEPLPSRGMRVLELWRYPIKSIGGERLDVAVAAGIALQFPKQVTEDEHWASAALYGFLDRGLLKHVVKHWPKDAGDPYARLFPAARKLRAFIEGKTPIGSHLGRPAKPAAAPPKATKYFAIFNKKT
mgnify:CR=1 FL=1